MRKTTLLMLAVGVVLAGCGGGPEAEAPKVSITGTSWSGDEIVFEADTNLPDGALVTWYVLEGDDWEDDDAADVKGFAAVSGGTATASVDVAEFTSDEAIVDVAFVPGYREQPEDVQNTYEDNEGASDEASVAR